MGTILINSSENLTPGPRQDGAQTTLTERRLRLDEPARDLMNLRHRSLACRHNRHGAQLRQLHKADIALAAWRQHGAWRTLMKRLILLPLLLLLIYSLRFQPKNRMSSPKNT
jgi:hypothetical protein